MNNPLKDYMEAGARFRAARKNKTTSDQEFEAARYQYQLARQELRAHEQEELTDKVLI
jgi:hypothetical protein